MPMLEKAAVENDYAKSKEIVPLQLRLVPLQLRLEFLTIVQGKPSGELRTFKQYCTKHYKNYSPAKLKEMINNSTKFPYCTLNPDSDEEKQLSWVEAKACITEHSE